MDNWTLLVTQAQRADEAAYGELVRRFQDMAYGYAYAILNDFHLAEDAAQEAFIEAYRCLPDLEHPQAFPAWLKRIVFKHCDRLTRGKRVPIAPLDAAEDIAAHTPGPAAIAEQRDVQAQVLTAVHALPESQREVTTLYYINGYSQNEIAAFLDVPPSTVKSRLYTSRQRLKERMMKMVQDTLKSNALPESFTEETLAQAVAQAAELNKQRQYGEAEDLLRDVLGKAPNHVDALRELNRAVMHGSIYGVGRWDRLPELVKHGKMIIASGSDDEYVYHEMARTLLAMPAIPEAVKFIEGWIERKGLQVDRLAMLAWAKGCVADYEQSQVQWDAMLALSQDGDPQDVMEVVQHGAEALVDCFASAGEMARAQHAAQTAWNRCRVLDAVSRRYRDQPHKRTDGIWLWMYHQAELPLDKVAEALRVQAQSRAEDSLEDQGVLLAIRVWTKDTQTLIPDCLVWVQRCIDAQAWHVLGHFSNEIGIPMRNMQQPDLLLEWAQAMWELLGTVKNKETKRLRAHWDWLRYHAWVYIEMGDFDKAEALAYRAIEELGYPISASFLIDIAAMRGEPTPAVIVRELEENGIEAIDTYGKWGCYLIAREAAAIGDTDKAFDALQRAVNYWTNPPLIDVRNWENDAYWGDLREHPEYKRIYAQKRQRIGPIHGQLWYFPGW